MRDAKPPLAYLCGILHDSLVMLGLVLWAGAARDECRRMGRAARDTTGVERVGQLGCSSPRAEAVNSRRESKHAETVEMQMLNDAPDVPLHNSVWPALLGMRSGSSLADCLVMLSLTPLPTLADLPAMHNRDLGADRGHASTIRTCFGKKSRSTHLRVTWRKFAA